MKIAYYALILSILTCSSIIAAHKPVDKNIIMLIFNQAFKNSGGVKAASLILSASTEDSELEDDKDLRLLFKAAGLDYDKALRSLVAASTMTSLYNSGIPLSKSMDIVKESLDQELTLLEDPIKTLMRSFYIRGVQVDSTNIAEALRQGEVLKHAGQKSFLAFSENNVNLDLIQSVIKSNKYNQGRITLPEDNP